MMEGKRNQEVEDSIGKVCVSRSETKTVGVFFVPFSHTSAKNEVHMHVKAKNYELCHSCDSPFELILYLHSTKMNSRTHANNLKF